MHGPQSVKLSRKLGGPHWQSGGFERETNLLSLQGIEPGLLCRPTLILFTVSTELTSSKVT